jgi:hypothetical protein
VNTIPGTYQQQLLLALRLHNIPGPRIAEALAEVDSHVAETGEDPYEAFGPPREYAQQLSGVLGGDGDIGWLSLVRSVTWRDGAVVLAFLTGSALLFQSVSRVGDDDFLGLPAVAGLAGLALLVALVAWVIRRLHREADPVLDPRTGTDMAPRFPRWTMVLWAFYPAALLLLIHLSGNAGR